MRIRSHAFENRHKVDFGEPVILSKTQRISKERKAAVKYLISRKPCAYNNQMGSVLETSSRCTPCNYYSTIHLFSVNFHNLIKCRLPRNI